MSGEELVRSQGRCVTVHILGSPNARPGVQSGSLLLPGESNEFFGKQQGFSLRAG